MTPQQKQQIQALLQQLMQIISVDDGTDGAGMNMDDDAGMDENDMPSNAPMGMMDEDEDDEMEKGSLDDRISRLEGHTGLRKSAASVPLVHRIDALEEHWLGETYEGSAAARVEQLESVALNKAAKTSKQERSPEADESPNVIELDKLIKSAVTQGIAMGMQQLAQQSEEDEMPSVAQLRKGAKRSKQVQYGNRRSQSNTVAGDAALIKSAEAWGYEEDDLDQPATLTDVLAAQYHAAKNGRVPIAMIEEED